MNVERRDFLKYVGTGAFVSALPPGLAPPPPEAEEAQHLHQDFQSNNAGTEYYFLGNGLILAALQTSTDPAMGTHCGLLLMSPEHFGRKISTYLYHPERGLQNSRTTVVVDRRGFLPEIASSKVNWEYPDGIPTIAVVWKAGPCTVREELQCPAGQPALVRNVTVSNESGAPVDASATVLLYPNLMFFDEYHVDRVRGTLTADGYETLRLFTEKPSRIGDRFVAVDFGRLAPGESSHRSVVITLNYSRLSYEKVDVNQTRKKTRAYWGGLASFDAQHDGLNHLFRSSLSGLRSAVAASGKMDGSVWQYNMEWVRDQSMVATAASMSGQHEIAGALLRRILTRSVDETGKTVESSRTRPPETMELDQNGELLYALYTQWVWSGSDAIIRDYWRKIRRVADYVLKPEFLDPSIGLLKNVREYWERDASFGVKEGYENAYQLWNIVGLERAALMAGRMRESAAAARWSEAARKMREAYVSHPKYALVDNGRFIKRRLATGEVQRTFEPINRASMPPGMPLNIEHVSYCEPDTSSVLPIVYGVVDAGSSLALNTLKSMEELWNQRWSTGGYARYNVTSEPDSPGPWPFPSMFVARAYLEAGNDEKAWRVLNWLLHVQGGKAGSWLEFYGDRPTPPLPPVGIVVWTWAEILMFVLHHLVGVRPSVNDLFIRPRLLAGLNRIKTVLPVHGKKVSLEIIRDPENPFALVNGRRHDLVNGALTLPIPKRDQSVEMHL